MQLGAAGCVWCIKLRNALVLQCSKYMSATTQWAAPNILVDVRLPQVNMTAL